VVVVFPVFDFECCKSSHKLVTQWNWIFIFWINL